MTIDDADIRRRPTAWTCCALAALWLGIAAASPAAAQGLMRRTVPQPLPGAGKVPIPDHQPADLARLHDELRREAKVESLLEDNDLRHLGAVRAYVDRTGRVAGHFLQDEPGQFADSREVVMQSAKEALRDYVKQQVGWERMEERLRIRVKSFLRHDDGAGSREAAMPGASEAAPAGAGSRSGAFEISPQLDVDLDDAEIGVDLGYDPGDTSFWSRWELSYGTHLGRDQTQLGLHYRARDLGFELTGGTGSDFRAGDFVAFSVTKLF